MLYRPLHPVNRPITCFVQEKDSLENMNVLVTGGAGFIGSHLVDRLIQLEHRVTVLDNLSTGKRENLRADPSAYTLVVGDVADPITVESVLAGQHAFVHLAAVASVEATVRDPVATHRTNLQGSIVLFDAAARLGVKRGVYASSAAVYGDNQDLPLDECSPAKPLSPYAADKLAGEHYLAHFHRSGSLDATAFRFFNVFGPRQDPKSPYSGVISIFLDRASRGAPITVFGDGSQTRDFVFVADVVDALVEAITSTTPREIGPRVFNVGRGKRVSLLELLSIVAKLPGVPELDVSFAPPRQGDIMHSCANVSRLLATGWRSTTDLESGLRDTLFSRPRTEAQ